MKFAVQVNTGPYGGEAGDSAYQFIRAAITRGHELLCVFFYHDGAYQGMAHIEPPAGEPNPAAYWSALAEDGGVDLIICISAAQRRGIRSPGQDLQTESPVSMGLVPGFRIGGLGLWVDACIKADRVLIFRN